MDCVMMRGAGYRGAFAVRSLEPLKHRLSNTCEAGSRHMLIASHRSRSWPAGGSHSVSR
jgi:hypothetical protein